MRKRFRKCITVTLLAALLTCVLPAGFSFAAVPSAISQPAEVTTFKSTANFDQEYLRAYVTTADDHVLKVIYRTPLETSLFRLSIYRTGKEKGDMDLDIYIEPKIRSASDGTPTYNFTYYLDMDELKIPDGKYTIYIRRCATEEDAQNLKYTSSGVLNKNMVFSVAGGKVSILRYMDVLRYNREIMAIGSQFDTSRYLDQTLEDIRFVLRDPVSNLYYTMTPDRVAYIKAISDRITAGAETDYEKLRLIYEYAASNFYYDTIAFQTHSNQYANPYDNIRRFEYGLTTVNSENGKVYTTCQGYSAIVVALARAQGIPARFVYGHRAAVPSHDWTIESNINVRDHWWAEAYADGRWIFIDPTVGTTNKYNSSTDKWTSAGLTNYTYFDPSEEQIATSHLYFNMYPDYRYGYYIDNAYEIQTLRTFLNSWTDVDPKNTEYNYGTALSIIQNGKLLNSSYASYDVNTWGDGTKSHFMTDGRGNVSQIQWSRKGFTGALILPDFTSMKLLSSHNNLYTSADLSGCSALEKIYLYNNDIVTLDLSDCNNAWYVRCRYNPMKNLTVYVNGENRTFTAGDHGTFSFTIDTRYIDSSFSLYSKPDTGYKVEGIYNTETGKKLSSKKTWHFTPTAPGYEICFTVNPNSYKYTLEIGDNTAVQTEKAKYLEAALKRLEELGYYTPSYYLNRTVYTGTMVDAAVKFQVMHDLPNTGTIDEDTWSTLFSEDALRMVPTYEYLQILKDYELRQAMKEEAQQMTGAVNLRLEAEAGETYIRISWTAEQISTGDILLDARVKEVLKNTEDPYFDGIEIWKSKRQTSGFWNSYDTGNFAKTTYKNTKGLNPGTNYYYKVRAYKEIDGQRFYTEWSNIICQQLVLPEPKLPEQSEQPELPIVTNPELPTEIPEETPTEVPTEIPVIDSLTE